MYKIKKIIDESDRVKTIVLDGYFKFKPGQFAMVWIPSVDEKPLGLLKTDGCISFGVLKVGKFTEKMHNLKEGDYIGVRGPYGTSFELVGDNILTVSGGIGTVPILSAVEEYSKYLSITSIIGFQCEEDIIYRERFEKCGETYICTDDGSCGYKGFPTELMEKIIKDNRGIFDLIITCGPEIMMKKVVEIGKKYNIPVQITMERYMKCGIGVCGQCAVDDGGLCICKDGPVFWSDKLKYISEFGKYKRDGSGKIIK